MNVGNSVHQYSPIGKSNVETKRSHLQAHDHNVDTRALLEQLQGLIAALGVHIALEYYQLGELEVVKLWDSPCNKEISTSALRA